MTNHHYQPRSIIVLPSSTVTNHDSQSLRNHELTMNHISWPLSITVKDANMHHYKHNLRTWSAPIYQLNSPSSNSPSPSPSVCTPKPSHRHWKKTISHQLTRGAPGPLARPPQGRLAFPRRGWCPVPCCGAPAVGVGPNPARRPWRSELNPRGRKWGNFWGAKWYQMVNFLRFFV